MQKGRQMRERMKTGREVGGRGRRGQKKGKLKRARKDEDAAITKGL